MAEDFFSMVSSIFSCGVEERKPRAKQAQELAQNMFSDDQKKDIKDDANKGCHYSMILNSIINDNPITRNLKATFTSSSEERDRAKEDVKGIFKYLDQNIPLPLDLSTTMNNRGAQEIERKLNGPGPYLGLKTSKHSYRDPNSRGCRYFNQFAETANKEGIFQDQDYFRSYIKCVELGSKIEPMSPSYYPDVTKSLSDSVRRDLTKVTNDLRRSDVSSYSAGFRGNQRSTANKAGIRVDNNNRSALRGIGSLSSRGGGGGGRGRN